MITAPGIYDIPIEEYHKKDGHISKSTLADILDCPAVYKYWQENQKPEKNHLNIGNCVHTLALEPELFAQRFLVLPECDRRTKEGKAIYAEALAGAGTKKIISKEDMVDITGMADSLRKNKKSLALLQAKGRVEASIYFEDDGLPFKCRPDYLRDDGLIVDLKTTKSAYKPFFQKDAWSYHYDISVALTSRGYKALTGDMPQNYVFLAVESQPPYLIEAYDTFREFDDMGVSFAKMGDERLTMAINKLKDCTERDIWPSYNDSITPLGVPKYAT